MIETQERPLRVGDAVELVTLPPGFNQRRALKVGLVGEIVVTGLELGWVTVTFAAVPCRAFSIAPRHLTRVEPTE